MLNYNFYVASIKMVERTTVYALSKWNIFAVSLLLTVATIMLTFLLSCIRNRERKSFLEKRNQTTKQNGEKCNKLILVARRNFPFSLWKAHTRDLITTAHIFLSFAFSLMLMYIFHLNDGSISKSSWPQNNRILREWSWRNTFTISSKIHGSISTIQRMIISIISSTIDCYAFFTIPSEQLTIFLHKMICIDYSI